MIHRFHDFHPFVTFIYYVGAISLLMIMLHPVFLVAAFLIILGINYQQDRCKGIKRWRYFILFSGLFIVVLNPLFNERGLHLLFIIFEHRVTLEAVLYGGITALSLIGIVSLFVSYNEVMTPNKLLFLFARVLPQFAVLLMLTLRFIPLMKRRLDDISAVQQSKAITVTTGTLRDKAHNGLLFVQVLLTYSLEEAIQTADSMKARGYGSGKRSAYEHYRWHSGDVWAISFLFLLLVGSLIGRMLQYGHLTIYPVMESIQLTQLEPLILLVFVLYLSFPLLVEGGSYLKWRIFN